MNWTAESITETWYTMLRILKNTFILFIYYLFFVNFYYYLFILLFIYLFLLLLSFFLDNCCHYHYHPNTPTTDVLGNITKISDPISYEIAMSAVSEIVEILVTAEEKLPLTGKMCIHRITLQQYLDFCFYLNLYNFILTT